MSVQIVFVVFANNFNGDDEFMGVYSSKQKAQEKINRYDRVDRNTMRIEEMVLDGY